MQKRQMLRIFVVKLRLMIAFKDTIEQTRISDQGLYFYRLGIRIYNNKIEFYALIK